MNTENSSGSTEGGISKRLDALIRLIMDEQVSSGKMKRGAQVLILDSIGLSSADIGGIINKPAKDVASWLRKLKEEKNKDE